MPQLRISQNGKVIKTVELEIGKEYLAGRDPLCQIELSDEAISRKHFKIWNNEGKWRVERVSKFGQLSHEGQVVSSIDLKESDYFSVGPFAFEFLVHDLSSVGTASSSEAEAARTQNIGYFGQELPEHTTHQAATQIQSQEEIQNSSDAPMDDEKTMVAATQVGHRSQGYLRVVLPSGAEETYLLDTEVLKIGRSPQCDIAIEDSKASRIHFEIRRVGNQFIIVDRGSSNGTRLNGAKIAKEDSANLASGDEIQVGQTRFIIEIRDPSFERQLQNVPMELLEGPAVESESYGQGQMVTTNENQYPVVQIPPGAGQLIFAGLPKKSGPDRKKLMFRGAIFLGLLVIGYIALNGDPEEKVDDKKPTTITKPADPFAALNDQEKQIVTSSYNLGKTLYMQQKYELALSEIQKVSQYLPAYKDSKEIEKYCQEAIDLKADQDRIKREQENKAKLVAKVSRIISECEDLVVRKGTLAQVQHCLEPVTSELDPENQKASQIISRLQKIESDRQVQEEKERHVKSNIHQGEDLYRRALAIKAKGNPYDAIEAFQRHIASSYADPENLKAKSQAEIASIKANLRSEVTRLVGEAKSFYSSKKMNDAMKKLDKALSIDADNGEAQSLKERIVSDLYKEMKAIYSDSVLEENLGNVEQAKEKWKKIIETDIPSGEYYQKAKSKLKKYGA